MTDLRKELPCTVNVLGTEYRVEMRDHNDDPSFTEDDSSAYCYCDAKLIVVGNLLTFPAATGTAASKEEGSTIHGACIEGECVALRHELIHAFLNESGLRWDSHAHSGAWAKNEEMIDWFAIQSPKIFATYKELGIL